MVKDFGVAKAENEVGYYSGVIASSFFLGQFLSGYAYITTTHLMSKARY